MGQLETKKVNSNGGGGGGGLSLKEKDEIKIRTKSHGGGVKFDQGDAVKKDKEATTIPVVQAQRAISTPNQSKKHLFGLSSLQLAEDKPIIDEIDDNEIVEISRTTNQARTISANQKRTSSTGLLAQQMNKSDQMIPEDYTGWGVARSNLAKSVDFKNIAISSNEINQQDSHNNNNNHHHEMDDDELSYDSKLFVRESYFNASNHGQNDEENPSLHRVAEDLGHEPPVVSSTQYAQNMTKLQQQRTQSQGENQGKPNNKNQRESNADTHKPSGKFQKLKSWMGK
mmetsp:Transcript_24901/g.32445  ORF Transcript_24901/g.32445 Transcript_24901/m.32445 type:complete len:284 (+) Transcript_24901:1-852(+)